MKAEHRHELKTNALAEWLAHSPDWARENLLNIVIVVATVLALGVFFFWRSHSKNAHLEEQYRFTGIVNQISNHKMRILGSRGQGTNSSADLFIPANSLAAFANSTDDDNLSALALIKQAEALRTQLHYRSDSVSKTDLTAQIGNARQSYTKALQKASDNASLAAAAKFGLGLCEEELGNFDAARKIYSEIVADSAFAGTVSVKQAEVRLATMADFQADVAFLPRPIPKPKLIERKPATIEMGPVDPNKAKATASQPKVSLGPVNTNTPAETQPVTVEPKGTATKPEVKIVPAEGETKSETPTGTVAPPDSTSTPKATDPNASSS